MITMKDYAKQQSVSYEAIRAMVSRYSEELFGHITIRNRTKYLDDWAVDFLTGKRKESPIVVINQGRDQEIADLKAELERLHSVIADLQEDRNRIQNRVAELLEDANKALEERVRYQITMENYKERVADYDNAIQRATDAEARLEEVRKAADADRQQLDEMKQERASDRKQMEDLRKERDDAVTESMRYTRTWFGLYRRS